MFLGYDVTVRGITPSTQNVEKLLNAQVKTIREVRTFAGLAQWNRRFIFCFSQIMQYLYAYTKKGARPPLTPKADLAVKYIKKQLSRYPALRFPDPTRRYHLGTDCSKEGAGAVLFQYDDEKHPYVVAYASCSMADRQHYTPPMMECFAAVWAMTHFRHLLQGPEFTLLTDCKAIEWLLKKGCVGPMARWAVEAQTFQFTVDHIAGKFHCGPDFMSRAGARGASPQDPDIREFRKQQWTLTAPSEALSPDPESPALCMLSDSHRTQCAKRAPSHHELLDRTEWSRAQHQDPEIKRVLQAFEATNPTEEQLLLRRWHFIDDDLVLFQNPNKKRPARVFVPVKLRAIVVHSIHGLLGHPSARKTLRTIGREFYFKAMAKYVSDYIQGCLTCARRKRNRPLRAGLTQPMLSTGPFKWIGIDFLHRKMPTSKDGFQYLLMVICLFTRWPIAIPLRTKANGDELAEVLFTHVFSQHGFPHTILSDNEPVLIGKALETLFTRMGVCRRVITVRHPQGNAHAERFGRYLNTALTTTLVHYAEWPRVLPQILFVYRVVPNESTGYSPFFLLYGRHPLLPMALSICKPQILATGDDVAINTAIEGDDVAIWEQAVNQYASDLVRVLQVTFKAVRSAQTKAALANKARRDQNRYPVTFQPGDQVLRYDPGHRDAFHSELRTHPFKGMSTLPGDKPKKPQSQIPQKLKFNWSGPWRVSKMVTSNVVYVEIFHPSSQEQIATDSRSTNPDVRDLATRGLHQSIEPVNVSDLVHFSPFAGSLPDSALLPELPDLKAAPQSTAHRKLLKQPPAPGALCVIRLRHTRENEDTVTVARFLGTRVTDPSGIEWDAPWLYFQWFGFKTQLHDKRYQRSRSKQRWFPGWMQQERVYFQDKKLHPSHQPYSNCINNVQVDLCQVIDHGFALTDKHRIPKEVLLIVDDFERTWSAPGKTRPKPQAASVMVANTTALAVKIPSASPVPNTGTFAAIENFRKYSSNPMPLRILQSLGFTGSLGRTGQGRTEPVAATLRHRFHGLGFVPRKRRKIRQRTDTSRKTNFR